LQQSPLNKIIKDKALDLGFNYIGFTNPEDSYNSNLDDWLDLGYNASMKWMSKSKEKRADIYNYFPEVKTVISFAYNYYTDENNLDNNNYKISNYAWGNDYHIILKKKLYDIIEIINQYNNNFKFKVCVDTAPVMEKYWAQKAGIGWLGKHTNLINSDIGSWFFLSEILLDFTLEFDKPFTQDLCGTCTKCIDSCPTDAIVDDYLLDANKCISYLTIEHRDSLPESLKSQLNNWIYGCDICQQVCPWNTKFSKITDDNNFEVRSKIKNKSNEDWDNLSVDEYRDTFKKSAIKRTKYSGIKRNISLNKK
jgi:epoxyqueuosine reductase